MNKKVLGLLCVLLVLTAMAIWFAFDYYIAIDYPGEPTLSGELKTLNLTGVKTSRTAKYYIPARLGANRPLIFVLHGSRGTGDAVRKMTGYEFDRLADSEKFIVVYPDGYEGYWNGCRGTANYSANTENIDDIGFFEAMIDYFAKNYRIDKTEVFATGFSNGGHMVLRFAFEIPDTFAAVAPIAANIPADENFDCDRVGKPVSIAIFNGTEDPINPYEGGLVEIFGDKSRGVVMSSDETVSYWKDLAGIDALPIVKEYPQRDNDPETKVIITSWRGANDIEVRLYTLVGSGHVVPSRKLTFGEAFGGSARDVEAADEIWDFFQQAGGKHGVE